MKRRTRRRLAGAAATAAAVLVLYLTENAWTASIVWLTVALLGLIRPRRSRHRRPRAHTRVRTPRPRIVTDIENTVHVLYRPYDHTRTLLYAGIVVTHPERDIHDRIDEHEDDKPWWDQVCDVVIEYWPTRTAAFAAEAYAIHTEHPVHNQTHRTHDLDACPTIRSAVAVDAWYEGMPAMPPPQALPTP